MIGLYCHHTARFERNTGIQRCVRALSAALIAAGEELLPLCWDAQSADLQPASAHQRRHLARWSGPEPERWSQQQQLPAGSWLLLIELVSGPHHPSWQQLQRLAKQHGWRLAAFFHDAIPLRWGGASAMLHRQYMRALAEIDQVLIGSAAMEAELVQFWKCEGITPKACLRSLPLAAEVPGWARVRQPEDSQSPPAGSAPLRLLQVGSLEPRKNHAASLKALAWMHAHQPGAIQLQLLGWPNDSRVVALVQRAIRRGCPVRWNAAADDAALRAAYATADLSLYPSLEEGFGLPVQESLWLGTPCITTAVPALEGPEGFQGCVRLRKGTWHELAQVLAALLNRPQQLASLRRQVWQRPLRSWRDVAAALRLQLNLTL